MREPGVAFVLSDEVYLKSQRTQRRFFRLMRRNLATATDLTPVEFERVSGNRLVYRGTFSNNQLDAASRILGLAGVEIGVEIASSDLVEIEGAVTAIWGDRLREGSYAVRFHRSGNHGWRSPEAERRIGGALQSVGNKVDLDDPDHLVDIRVNDDRTWVTTRWIPGPGGLPLGSQEPVLGLLSGGFDSAVAAFSLMRRGSPVHYLHFGLDCAQSDHALAVADTLHRRWGHGFDPTVNLVDFQNVKEDIRDKLAPRMRQVVLKAVMARAAGQIADDEGVGAIATGDALGQVSSQTLTHLRAVDAAAQTTVLRPLLGLDKRTIIDMARQVGTAELSARAREVCDLAEGMPVAVEAPVDRVLGAVSELDESIVGEAIETRQRFPLADWAPGLYRIGDAA